MMNSTTNLENMKNKNQFLARFGVRATRVLFRFMPRPVYYLVCPFLRAVAGLILKRKLKIIRENLKIAYGTQLSEVNREDIGRECLRNFSTGLIELGYIADRPEILFETVSLEGEAFLKQALAVGQGAILLGAHFGNFIMMYLALVQRGYKVNVIMKPSHDSQMEVYIENYRAQRGIQTIYSLPARKCVVESLKALKRNEILIILLDQNFGGDGRVFVDFFGHTAATATGPVVFAQRSGAPILPIFMMKSDGHFAHRLEIRDALELQGQPQDSGFVQKNVQMMTQLIEDQIRAVPHEWAGWMHKRWKSRTREEQTIIDRLKDQGYPVQTFYN